MGDKFLSVRTLLALWERGEPRHGHKHPQAGISVSKPRTAIEHIIAQLYWSSLKKLIKSRQKPF
jgi:hypothetical protein